MHVTRKIIPVAPLVGVRRTAFCAVPQHLRRYVVGAVIFVLSLTIFLAGIDQPRTPYFDEVHYVPAARQMLHSHPGEVLLNQEHPPLGKALMAAGIAVAGDNALGWRMMSAVFGALALVGIYAWAFILFGRQDAAIWAAVITFANQLLYVQARIATLDIFVVAFMVWALAAFSATWKPEAPVKLLFAATGTLLGLALACKWVGVFALVLCVAIVIAGKVLQQWGTRFAAAGDDDWYRPDLWRSMRSRDFLLCLGVIPVAIYVAAFALIHGYSLGQIVAAQGEMWRAQQHLAPSHPYMSNWTTWPLALRPIWYLFAQREIPADKAAVAAVVALGNPVVLWAGLPAVLVCGYDWLMGRRWNAFLIFAAYLALYGAWAVVPRSLTFFYYYLPGTMVLSLALTYLFYRTQLLAMPWTRHVFAAIALIGFCYFLPVTSAAVGTSLTTYGQRMWFESWR